MTGRKTGPLGPQTERHFISHPIAMGTPACGGRDLMASHTDPPELPSPYSTCTDGCRISEVGGRRAPAPLLWSSSRTEVALGDVAREREIKCAVWSSEPTGVNCEGR